MTIAERNKLPMTKVWPLLLLVLAVSSIACERKPTDPAALEMLKKAEGGYYTEHPYELVQPKGKQWSVEARETARTLYAQYAKGLNDEGRRAIREGRVLPGMTDLDVLVVLGYPEEVKRAHSNKADHQRWTYSLKADEKKEGSESGKIFFFFGDRRLQNWVTPRSGK